MMIQPFPSGPFETNAYVVACLNTKKAAIIDPAPNSTDAITSFLKSHDLKLKIILITHSHWDHIADTAKFKVEFKAPVYIHSLDVPNLQNPGSDGLPLWFDIEGVLPDRFLTDGDIIEIGNLQFKVIHTPGHTPGGVCFYCEEEGVLIAGDTLFKGSIGNLSFPTANASDMWKSLAKLAHLPPETKVYPGHGPSTTIGKEHWLARAQEIFGS
jgi:glyoxylase-like metal-dependent hydrolase (beta-lactamase superfamily II)